MTSVKQGTAILVILIGLYGTYENAYGDLIAMAKGSIEGRVLENSARVLVVETIAGEQAFAEIKERFSRR